MNDKIVKLPKRLSFYFFAIPVSFLAGYGYASSLWILHLNKVDHPPNIDI